MTKNISEWKREARQSLRGNYMLAITGMILTTMLSTLASNLTNSLFPGDGIFVLILAELFAFIVSLVMNILMAGYSYILLKIARREHAELGDIFYFFKNGPDRVIVAGFAIVLIQWLSSLPTMIYSMTVPIGEGDLAFVQWQGNLLKWMLVAILVQAVLTLPFTLVYFVLSDHPDMGGLEALKQGAAMMKGHYLHYILLELSFLPLILLSTFTLYIALLWIIPYMKAAGAVFYRDINGEYLPYVPQIAGDDYNSEA